MYIWGCLYNFKVLKSFQCRQMSVREKHRMRASNTLVRVTRTKDSVCLSASVRLSSSVYLSASACQSSGINQNNSAKQLITHVGAATQIS